MRRKIDYRTITWEESLNFDGAAQSQPVGPGRLSFDALEPVACRGKYYPVFRFSYFADGAVDSILLYLRDPRDDARRIILVDSNPATDVTWFRYDCCCEGHPVPFVLEGGPLPRFELVFQTTGDVIRKYVVIETWWEPDAREQSIGTSHGVRG